jgi:hypothetical protein
VQFTSHAYDDADDPAVVLGGGPRVLYALHWSGDTWDVLDVRTNTSVCLSSHDSETAAPEPYVPDSSS